MFLTDEERRMARPKIAVVRDFIGAINDNPFLHGLPRKVLLETMDEIASDVESAARKLSEMAGIENTLLDGVETPRYLASGIIALSHVNEENVDLTLSNKFMESAAVPFFKLRELEEGQKADGLICPQTATEAMVGLASLHLIVKAVPAVYEYLSAPSMNGAVA